MKKVAYWAVLGALFCIPFLPLYVAGAQFFPFITGKGFAFRVLVEIAVVGWIVLMLADARYRPRFSWVMVLYVALAAWMFIANLLGENPHKAFWSNYERMDGWVTLIHVFGFFLVASSVLTVQKLWQKWWLTFIGASALVAGFALLQLSGALQINQGGVRVDATFGNAAYLAAYLLFVIAVSIWQGIEAKEKWLKYSLYVLSAIHVFILFCTATRGAILGALGGAVLAAFLFAVMDSSKRTKKVAAGALVGLLVLVGGFMLVRDTGFIQNDPTLSRLSSISLEEGSTRFAIWEIAGQGITERPLMGWGQEGFNYVFNNNYNPKLYDKEVWFDRAHDVYLDWAIAGGIPALLLFLGLLGTSAWTLFRAKTLSRAERILLLSALGAYMFQALFVFDNLFTYVPLAAILAVAHAASAREIKQVQAWPVVQETALQTIVLPAAVVLLIATIWIVNIPGRQAARHLILALSPTADGTNSVAEFKRVLADNSYARQEIREYIVQHAVDLSGNPRISAEAKAEEAAFAVEQMSLQVAENPKDVRLRYHLALAYRVQGNTAKALEQMDAAIALSPKKQFLHQEKGLTALENKNYPLALEAFKQAYELNTANAGAAAYYAAGKIYAGDWEGAQKLLNDNFSTTTVDNQALARAYYETKRFNEFVAIWQLRVAQSGGSPSSRFGLASAYVVAGRVPEAIAEIRATITTHPEAAQQGTAMLQQLGAGVR